MLTFWPCFVGPKCQLGAKDIYPTLCYYERRAESDHAIWGIVTEESELLYLLGVL